MEEEFSNIQHIFLINFLIMYFQIISIGHVSPDHCRHHHAHRSSCICLLIDHLTTWSYSLRNCPPSSLPIPQRGMNVVWCKHRCGSTWLWYAIPSGAAMCAHSSTAWLRGRRLQTTGSPCWNCPWVRRRRQSWWCGSRMRRTSLLRPALCLLLCTCSGAGLHRPCWRTSSTQVRAKGTVLCRSTFTALPHCLSRRVTALCVCVGLFMSDLWVISQQQGPQPLHSITSTVLNLSNLLPMNDFLHSLFACNSIAMRLKVSGRLAE